MTKLKQGEVAEALIQLVNVRYLIDDGFHENELVNIVKVSNTLFDELNDANKAKFQICLTKKMEMNITKKIFKD